MNNSTIFNIDHNIGGIPYILNYLSIYIPYTTLSFIGIIIGVIGNSLIGCSILYNKELRTNSTCLLILNLSLADFIISLVVNSFTIVGTLAGKKFFDENFGLCVFIASACLVSCGNSLLTMGFLALNRYVCIFNYKKFETLFSFKKTIFYCTLTWVIAIIVDLPNFSDLGGHVFDKKTLSCVFDRLKFGYTITFLVTCIYIPCLLITFCYLRIFCHAYNIKTKINDKNNKINRKLEAIKISKSLFSSFFLFSICWIPVSIIFIIGKEDQLPIPAHAFTNLPAHLNSALNPILYALFNPKIKEGYIKLLNYIFCNKLNINKIKSEDFKTSLTVTKTI